jgi:hypothetical protein
VKLLPLPVALPGKCIVCGASDNTDGRKYLDFGFEIDFYGVVYFCTHCFSETAKAVGYISPDVASILDTKIEEITADAENFRAENVKLRVALNQLDFLGSNPAPVVSNSDIKSRAETKRSDDSKSAKQNNESGRADVPKTGKSDPDSEFSIDLEDFD